LSKDVISQKNQQSENETKAGYIIDFISGEQVKETPEEVEAVQVFAHALVEDYGYPVSAIHTRPQWRVKVRPSDTHKEYPIDIAVFEKDKQKTDDSLFIVVECKKKTRKDGLTQLQDYLRFSKARLGVWFNGAERIFIKKIEQGGEVKFETIPNIPRYGERLEDIGKFKRKDLTKAHNLKVIFRAIRNHLAGNTVGTTRDEELARQLINIIFCKIYDERFTKPNDLVTFRAGVDEPHSKVSERIHDLFSKVKSKYSQVIDQNETINLDDKSLVYTVGELQNFCITEIERDVIADAFETFIGYALKGGQGQFFTPRNVVKLMVEIVNPQPDQLLIDPACGSGGFLIESLKHAWNSLDKQAGELGWSELALNEEKIATAIHNIRGIEKDEFLSKVAKAYMAIIGDGKGGIFCEDSLELPENWHEKTRQSVQLETFDILLTNPPFGKDIKIVGHEKLAQYELAHKWKLTQGNWVKTNSLNTVAQPQVLFIERSLQLLKKGGILGIVLPETFFHAPRINYVMRFMQQHNIQWLIDLPHNTFRPHNNAKCVVIILQKGVPQQKTINMAVAEEMGHDHQGKEIYRWDYKKKELTDVIWDDIESIISEFHKKKKDKFTFAVDEKIARQNSIFVPRYYWKTKDSEVESIAKSENLTLVPLRQLINEGIILQFDGHGSPPAEYKGMGEVPYIRVKDIVNWEIYKDPTSQIPHEMYLQMKGKKKDLHPADVLYVRRGSYRIGSVAMVSPLDIEVLLTREIVVLRVVKPENKYGIDPYYLLYLLSHKLTTMQTFNKVLIETTLPNIADRYKELGLPVSNDEKIRRKIAQQVKEIVGNKWSANSAIQKLEEYGDLTT
jgi:type I restriction enzyme M protein